MSTYAIKGKLINPISQYKTDFFENGLLVVENHKIVFAGDISQYSANLPEHFETLEEGIISPGFIDSHLHIPQVNQRARYGKTLLNWLQKYIYSAESKFSNSVNAKNWSINFFKEMLRNGTTSCLAFSSISESATDMAFQIADKMGVRAIIGKVMMDFNPDQRDNPPEKTKKSIESSINLMKKWHNYDSGRLQYAFTPRFAPSCTRELMHESSRIAKENKCIIQTHLSENEEEISLVLKLFPECKSYTEVYKKYNCLYEKSVTAHCLHLSESEIELLAENNVSIAHCPSSNFFLKSGSIKFNNIHNKGINICLGSDVGAGPSFSLFDVIKSMNYMQPFNILPQKCFYMATIGGAKALDINNVTGSLVSGKDADFIILNPWSCYPEFKIESIEDLLAFLYYLGSSSMVERSFVRGKKIYDSHRNSQIMHSNYSYLID